jgi:glycine hydroxymethyltransferase
LAEASRPEFRDYAQKVVDNARALADGLLRRGAELVTGGTDNHLVLMDVSAYGLTGRQAEAALLEAGLVTNRNAVPRDPNGAWYTSGIRLGTPALTTRRFDQDELREVAGLLIDVLEATQPAGSRARYALEPAVAARVQERAAELLTAHPLYGEVDLSS